MPPMALLRVGHYFQIFATNMETKIVGIYCTFYIFFRVSKIISGLVKVTVTNPAGLMEVFS